MTDTKDRLIQQIEAIRSGRDDEILRRRAICVVCPEHTIVAGKLRCNICGCGDPATTRPWCPAGKWGQDALAAAQAKHDQAAKEEVRPMSTPAETPASAPADPPAPTFLVSVVIASRQEGDEIRHTVQSAIETATGPLEVIVVDDASTDGSCENLHTLSTEKTPVHVIRNRVPRGAGMARNIGMAAARGRVVVACDAHMRFPQGLWHEIGAFAIQQRAIACPIVCSMLNNAAQGGGAYLKYHPSHHVEIKYEEPRATEPTQVEAVVGACYFVPREIVHRLPSWPSIHGLWGHEEEALSIWAWLHEIPVYCYPQFRVRHLYRSEINQGKIAVPWGGPPPSGLWLNRAVAYLNLFEPETWKAVWRKPLMDKLDDRGRVMIAQIEAGDLDDCGQWREGKTRTDIAFHREVLCLPCIEGPGGTVRGLHPLQPPKPKPITILLTTFERDHLLEFGLRSIARQKRTDCRVIVLNDGSAGTVQAICRKYGAEYIDTGCRTAGAALKWRIPGFAMNAGVKLCNSEFIVMSCAEIYHLDDCLEKLLAPLLAGADRMALAIPKKIGGGWVDNGSYLKRLQAGEPESAEWLKGLGGLQTSVPFLMAMRREHYIAIGGYDEDFTGHSMEDCDFVNRLIGYGCHHAETEAHCVHLWHGDQHPDEPERYRHNSRMYSKRLGILLRNQDREWGTLSDPPPFLPVATTSSIGKQ